MRILYRTSIVKDLTHVPFPAMAAEAFVLFLDKKNQKLSVATS
jgi:hypothetical protein